MDWQKDWWRYVAVAVVVVGLAWWRNQAPKAPVEEKSLAQVTEERTNQFLEDAGIIIPEGSERANLEDVTATGATGIATRREVNGRTEVTVIAGVPNENNTYVGWLTNASGEYTRMGTLRVSKGGLTLEYSGNDLDELNQVVVSEEMNVGNSPTKEVLRGTFAN
jgi:hypothetical protein